MVLSTTLTTFTWASTNTKMYSAKITNIDIPDPVEEVEEPVTIGLTEEEIDLIALITMAEAEGESELGQRLVIDTILNRVDHVAFDDTVTGVVYAPYQYECVSNGRADRCEVRDDIRQLVIEEAANRTNTEVLFFRTLYYHDFGVPLLQEGAHYFSGL